MVIDKDMEIHRTVFASMEPLDNNADNTLKQLVLRDNEAKGIQKLHPAKRLSSYFSDEPEEHVHVIVQPPSPDENLR